MSVKNEQLGVEWTNDRIQDRLTPLLIEAKTEQRNLNQRIASAVQKELDDFHEQTGLSVSGVDVNIISVREMGEKIALSLISSIETDLVDLK